MDTIKPLMVREVIFQPGKTFQEFTLLPGQTPDKCIVPNISLETRLADNLTLNIPLISVAMTSVTGYVNGSRAWQRRRVGRLADAASN